MCGRARRSGLIVSLALALAGGLVPQVGGQEGGAMVLPKGVKAVWNLGQAYREKTATQERVCINGLWRWQPAGQDAEAVPDAGWGYFKVPGPWPGIGDSVQKDSQTVFRHPGWQDANLAAVREAWYEREMAVPAEWAGRRIALYAEYVNSVAVVYVDRAKVGEIRFPAGELDLTVACRPGAKHVLNIRVAALPLEAVMMSYSDSASARQVRGSVARRGLCGDVYLTSAPAAARVSDVKVDTSVRKWEVTFSAALAGLAPGASYRLRARLTDGAAVVQEFPSKPFNAADLKDGRLSFTASWHPDKLWDLHTPQNIYGAGLSLTDEAGKVLDEGLPVRFGFREFWIHGRDFSLNGTRIVLSILTLENAQVGASAATYAAARETIERQKSFGINFSYTHNYGCQPGAHVSFEELLRAADDAGMLISFSMPHFGHYKWDAPEADRANGYAAHAAFYVRAAQNHPSVVAYSMSHNSTGYAEDSNPDMMDGIQAPRDTWAMNNMAKAVRAEAIVHALDPTRFVYHHASGNLGSVHNSNFYTNFTPIQEMSDWFGHWATVGVKPLFPVEYGVPFSWDWAMYRGWYKGKREFGSAVVPWELCIAEWNAQFLGDRAYKIEEAERADLRWEAEQFRAGRLWHRWDYPYQVRPNVVGAGDEVFEAYTTDNLRAFRTWGASASYPWDRGPYWRLRDGVDKSRKELPVDWEDLQRPGLSPDYLGERYESFELAYERSDWIPTRAGRALIRNNQPLLAYIGGKPDAFTSKDHIFYPGETFQKQLIILNNSRVPVSCVAEWKLALPAPLSGRAEANVPAGKQALIPLTFELPTGLAPGACELSATVRFSNGEEQADTFAIHVLPLPGAVRAPDRLALFDPRGETAKLLGALGVPFQAVDAGADLAAYDALVIGKGALTLDGPAPDVTRVRDGLRVIVFEQAQDVLEKRLGFRAVEYGLRQVFRRVPDHPLTAGLAEDELRDWRGEATNTPPRLNYVLDGPFGKVPTVKWCDIPVTRAWRCGNRGSVASVLIEKPPCGDFLPILDGGFALQYATLMEYREGKGMVLFCQTDVSGRTEPDPAADALARNILRYVSEWRPAQGRAAVYVGDEAGAKHLEAAGFPLAAYGGGAPSPDQVLVVGPGGGRTLARSASAIADWLKGGGHVLAIGLDGEDASAFLPMKVSTRNAEHIAAHFDPFPAGSPLAGVSPAEVHNRDPREMPLVAEGAEVVGDGVLATAEAGRVVFCQLAPWQFDYSGEKMNIKRTFRRVSCLATRLLANMGATGRTPLLERFASPVAAEEKRWLNGFYLDTPEEWDDPYRFFRW